MQEFLRCWGFGKELDFCSSGGKWDGEIMIDRPGRDGPGFIKGVIPTINTKTSNLVGGDGGVIQFGATMKRLIHNQNTCLVGSRVIPGCSTGSNRDI